MEWISFSVGASAMLLLIIILVAVFMMVVSRSKKDDDLKFLQAREDFQNLDRHWNQANTLARERNEILKEGLIDRD